MLLDMIKEKEMVSLSFLLAEANMMGRGVGGRGKRVRDCACLQMYTRSSA